MHKLHWTVIYPNGHRVYFKTEEAARTEAFLHGIGLIPPLYREI
jgi:hypothetical protein